MTARTEVGAAALAERPTPSRLAEPRPVTVAGIGTALPPYRVGGDEVLRMVARLWPRLEHRVGLFTGELAGGHRHLVRPLEEAMRPLAPGEQASRYAAEATTLALAAAERAL